MARGDNPDYLDSGSFTSDFEPAEPGNGRELAPPPLVFEKPEAARPSREPPQSDLLSPEDLSAAADFYSAAIDSALTDRAPLEALWLDWTRLYEARPEHTLKTYPFTGCSNVVVPIVQKHVNRVHARIMRAIFAIEPHWTAIQRNRQFASFAKPLERYMDAIRADTWDQYKVVKFAVLDCLKYGTGIIYNSFDDEVRWRYDAAQRRPVPAGRRFGPRPMWIAREDYLQPQGFASPEAAPWAAVRLWFSFTRLRQLEATGVLLPGSVDRVRSHPDEMTELARLRAKSKSTGPADSADPETGLWAPWLVHFRRDMDRDGYPEEYTALVHAGSRTVMKIDPNPHVDGMRPLVVLRFIEIEGEFDGMGIPEMVKHQQEEASTIHNERRDNAHLANMKMFVSSDVGNMVESIKMEPFRVYKFAEPEKFAPIELRDSRQADAFEEQIVLKLADETVGISEIGSGGISSPMGRAAASTVMAALQETSERFDVATSEIRLALSEQGNQVLELIQEYGLPEPDEAGAPEQFLDSDDATKIRQLFAVPDSVRGLVKLRLNVATAAVNREVEKQSTVQLQALIARYAAQMQELAVAIQNPAVPPALKQQILQTGEALTLGMKKIFQAFQSFDFESVLMQETLVALAEQPTDPRAMLANAANQNPSVTEPGGERGGGTGAGPGLPPTLPGTDGSQGGGGPFPSAPRGHAGASGR